MIGQIAVHRYCWGVIKERHGQSFLRILEVLEAALHHVADADHSHQVVVVVDLTDAAHGLEHERPTALRGRVGVGNASDVGCGLDQRFARASQRLVLTGKRHARAHGLRIDPGVRGQPDRVRSKSLVVFDDAIGQHLGPERVLAEGNARELGTIMHGERTDRRTRDRKPA